VVAGSYLWTRKKYVGRLRFCIRRSKIRWSLKKPQCLSGEVTASPQADLIEACRSIGASHTGTAVAMRLTLGYKPLPSSDTSNRTL